MALGCIHIVHGCELLIRVTDRRFSLRARAVGRAGAGVISLIILVVGVVSYAVEINSALTLLIRLDV